MRSKLIYVVGVLVVCGTPAILGLMIASGSMLDPIEAASVQGGSYTDYINMECRTWSDITCDVMWFNGSPGVQCARNGVGSTCFSCAEVLPRYQTCWSSTGNVCRFWDNGDPGASICGNKKQGTCDANGLCQNMVVVGTCTRLAKCQTL